MSAALPAEPMSHSDRAPAESATAERVLVVDDDPEIRNILAERLRIEGFQVDLAGSGEAALLRYLSRRRTDAPYTVAVIDIRLGALDGTDLLRLIRMLDRHPTILMISGGGDLAVAVQSVREGADDYLGKPLKIWDIKNRLMTAIGRRRSIDARPGAADRQGLVWGGRFQAASSGQETREGSAEDERAARAPLDEPTDASVPTRSRTHERSRVSENVGPPSAASNAGDRPGRSRPGSSQGAPKQEEMGRETGSGSDSVAAGAYERRFGESCAGGPPREDAAETPGREGFSRDRAHELPGTSREGIRGGGGSTERLGERDEAWASSPLNALFLLGRRVEAELPGWSSHSDRLAACLTKLGAYLAGRLHLRPVDLDALSIVARLHVLGLVQRLRPATPPLHPERPPAAADPAGDRVANLSIPLRLTRELRRMDAPGVPEDLLDTTLDLLRCLSRRRRRSGRKAPAGGAEDRDADKLATLFDVADRWTRLTRDLEPKEAAARLRADPAAAGETGRVARAALRQLAIR